MLNKSAKKPAAKTKWIVLILTFVFAIGINSFRNSFQFLLLPMSDTFNIGRSSMSLPISFFMITTGIVNFFVGFLIDKYSVRKIMGVGITLLSLSLLILPHALNISIFSVIYGVVGGIGYACSFGVSTQYFISRWFDSHKGFALSILQNANSAGVFLLSPLWVAAPYSLGWQNTYTILGLVLLFILLPVLIIWMKNPPNNSDISIAKKYNFRGFISVLKTSKLIYILYFGVFTCGFTMGIIDAHLVPILEDAHLSDVNGLMSTFGACVITGGILSGWLSDLFGKRILILSILFFIRLLSFCALLMSILLLGQNSIYFLIFNILFGISYTGVVPLTTAHISEHFDKSITGSLLGISFLIHQVAGSIGVYLGGVVYDLNHNYLIVIIICIALTGISSIIELFSLKKGKSPIYKTKKILRKSI